MGYGTTTNTILLPDGEEQLVREELNRIANNPNAGRSGHGTTSPGREGYVVKKYHLETCLNKELKISNSMHMFLWTFFILEEDLAVMLEALLETAWAGPIAWGQ